jgi:arylsulfatase A-like enzyme
VKPGAVVSTPVSSPDYFATLADVTGTKPTSKIDGVSLLPVLEGKGDLPERPLFWHYPALRQSRRRPGCGHPARRLEAHPLV